MNSRNIATTGLVAVLIVGVILIGPLLTIWSLNTLFALSIAYTAKNWFAAFILTGIVTASVKKS